MNIAMDYRAQMQRAALLFMRRHQAEHLADEQNLQRRALGYLVNTLNVPLQLAPVLVERAAGDLGEADERYLDVSSSLSDMAMISDPVSGQTYAIPVAWICRTFIDSRPPALPTLR